MSLRLRGSIAVLAVLTASCVPYTGEPVEMPAYRNPSVDGAFQGLDPGANEQQSLHFVVRAYGPDTARVISDQAEAAYNRIMTDTGLYSFRPAELYRVVVYGSPQEYRKKTGQPEWSAGLAAGNSLYFYFSDRHQGVLAHEMTHLIWHEFFRGRLTQEHRWINEGLAVYQEARAVNQGRTLFFGLQGQLRSTPVPMDQMLRLVPATERSYDVSLWYAQAESMVRYMIERGGRIGFGKFLESLRDGHGLDAAVNAGFPGQWRSLADFEADWRRSLG